MPNPGSRAVLPAAIACLAVLLVTAGLHPVLLGPGPLPETARDLGGGVRLAVQRLGLLGEIDRGSIPAVGALVLSLLYASGYVLLRLGRPPPGGPRALPGGSPGLALAVIPGHLAGWLAAERGERPAAVHAWTLGIALFVAILLLLRKRAPSPDRPGPRARRSAVLLLTSIVFVLALRPFDVVAAWGSGAPQYPELWYVLVPALIAPGAHLLLVGLALVSLPVVLLVGERGEDDGWARQALLTTPAWALILGPSNPFQALGVAVALARMRTAGVDRSWRIAFVLAVVGLPVVAAALV